MGVFDPENSLSIESTPEVEPSTNGDTSTEDGHVVEEKETQAPETTEETKTQGNETQEVKEEFNESEESKESEVTQKDEEDKQQEPQQKLYAGKFKTIGWLFNGINDAASRLGETIDLNRINSIEDAEAYYKELQQRIGRGEAKNYSRAEQKETIKAKDETLPQIEPSEFEKNLAKIIEDSKAALQQLETETVDDEDDEIFEAKFAENPKRALAERDAKIISRLEKKFEAMLNLKGAELAQTLAPILEGYRYWQDQAAGRDAWNQALSNMDAVLKEHGIDDFEKDLPAVLEIIKNDPQLIDLVNASPRDVKVRETVLRIAYRDLKSKAKETDLQKQLAEFAKATAEKDAQKIKDSKVGLKMQNGIGGAANSQPKKENDLVKIFGERPESTGVFD